MNELIKLLEEIQSRTGGIADEMTTWEIGTSSLVDQALVEAREHASRVDQLHEVITGNVEHAVAAWMDAHASAWQAEMDRNPTAGWSGEQMRPLFYRQMAQLIRQGEWKK